MKRSIFFGIFLLLLAPLAFLLSPLSSNLRSAPNTEFTVDITSEGFVPLELSLLPGDKIRFVNKGREKHTVEYTPSEKNLIERTFEPGETWLLEMRKKGSVSFNEKERPQVQLLVHVGEKDGLPETDPALNWTDSPQKEKNQNPCEDAGLQAYECYKDFYTGLTKREGLEKTIAQVKEAYPFSVSLRNQCHSVMHILGRAASKNASSIAEAFASGDSFCWSGYYHGVMETFVEKTGSEKIPEKLDGLCTEISGKEKRSFDYYNCVHGIGHGLMSLTENELFDSLNLCGHLTGEWEKSACASGAFMENVIADNQSHFTKYLRPTEPLYPCPAVEERYKSPCWLMQTSYMLKVMDWDFERVFKKCGEADPGYVTSCYESLGRDASSFASNDREKIKRLCLIGDTKDANFHCFLGAAYNLISYYHSNREANYFCRSLSHEYQLSCFKAVREYFQAF